MLKKRTFTIKPLTIVILSALILIISIGGRECGGKSKKNRASVGSSDQWAGIRAPSNVFGITVSPTVIQIYWQDNSNNEDGFYVERKTESDGVYTQIGDARTNINYFYDTNSLCPGNTYYYRIRAYMTTGDISNYSPEGSILLSLPVSGVYASYWNAAAQIGNNSPIWIWGYNNYGQLGLGFTNYSVNIPKRAGSDIDWSNVVAGGSNTLFAIKNGTAGTGEAGTLWGCGWNFWGQLGMGNQDNKYVLTKLNSDFWENTFEGIEQVVCGEVSVYARKSDGTLWSWGDNQFGELGVGDTEDTFMPYQVGTQSDWASVSAGAFHGAAKKNNGTIWSWGDGSYAQLGLGGLTGRYSPAQIGTATDWSTIEAGSYRTFAIKNNPAGGTLWGWGSNIWGELGVGGYGFVRFTPTQIGTDSDWLTVKGGYMHALALKTNRTMWAWGDNSGYGWGELGLGDNIDRNTPTMVGTDSDWDKISAAVGFSLASKLNGTIWATGNNSIGQLGLGETNFYKNTFTRVRIGVPDAPSSLTATVVSAGQVNLSWVDNSSDELVFRVERKTGLNGAYAEIGLTVPSMPSYADTTVSNYSSYYYRVRAHNVYGNGPYSPEISVTTLQTPPPAPTVLTATAVTSTIITLVWDDVIGETGYRIERSTPATATYVEIALVSADITGYTDTTVDPLTAYYYRVIAYNSIGNSDYSPEGSVTTPLGPPNIPGICDANVVSATRVDVSWDDVRLEDGYKVERKTGLGGTYGIITTTTVADVTSYSDTTVMPATSYYYRVKAYNSEGDSGYTNERSITTPDVPPNAPTALTCTPVVSTKIDLTWNDNSTNETGFRIERGPDGINFSQIKNVNSNITSYSDTTVGPETAYYYRIYAYNSAGLNYSSIVSGTTPSGPPNSPQILVATVVSATQVNLQWQDVIKETGYRIERRTGTDGSYAAIATVSPAVDTMPPATINYSDTAVQPATTYFYRVQGFNTYGDSPYYSPQAAVRTWSGRGGNSITAGYDYSIVLRSDGTLWSWGYNIYGQLGTGVGGWDGLGRRTPAKIGSDTDWLTVSASGFYGHNAALKLDGRLFTWGYNGDGQLGIGSTQRDTSQPGEVYGQSSWIEAQAGGLQTYALKTNGTVWACGFNVEGELGLGDTVPRNILTQVGTANDWVSISHFHWNLILKKTNNTIWMNGWNRFGQLGLGDTIDRLIPTPVGTDSDWSVISAGVAHTLAIKQNGTIWSCGYNNAGQLGLNDNTNRYILTRVGTSSDWADVSGGGDWPGSDDASIGHTMAVKLNGTIWAWGYNYYGQLGLGDNTNRLIPTQVGTASDWYAVSAGAYHTLGMKPNGSIWAWGRNNQGQLGIGNTIDKNIPTLIENW